MYAGATVLKIAGLSDGWSPSGPGVSSRGTGAMAASRAHLLVWGRRNGRYGLVFDVGAIPRVGGPTSVIPRAVAIHCVCPRLGCIPSRAGEPGCWKWTRRSGRGDPLACGGTEDRCRYRHEDVGRSPRAWGNPSSAPSPRLGRRMIPLRVGFPVQHFAGVRGYRFIPASAGALVLDRGMGLPARPAGARCPPSGAQNGPFPRAAGAGVRRCPPGRWLPGPGPGRRW